VIRDDLAVRRLLAGLRGTARDVAGELMVFCEHVTAAERLADGARRLGYAVDRVGCELVLRRDRGLA